MTDEERKIAKLKKPREIIEILIELEIYKAVINAKKTSMKWEIFRKP